MSMNVLDCTGDIKIRCSRECPLFTTELPRRDRKVTVLGAIFILLNQSGITLPIVEFSSCI